MKRFVVDNPGRVCQWVAERIGCAPWNPDHAGAVGLERDGELVAGFVLDGYIANGHASMHSAVADKFALTRDFLHLFFDWAFHHLDLKVLINRVSSGNEASLKATAHLGYSEFARFPLAWDGEHDLVLFEMRRENCPWLRS